MSGIERMYVISFVTLVLCVMLASSLQAEIPHKINYQGKLTDSTSGAPEAGTHSMAFRIYDDPGGSTLLWSESQTASADSAGTFSVLLGSITPIDISFDGPVWLEVEVGGEVLSPRREIVSVPFAFLAEAAEHSLRADSLGGYAPGDFVREGETSVITSEMIADGTGSGLDADMVDGLSADAFADTGHAHDDRYYTQGELNTPGVINESSNPVDWTRLKNVPAGFADGDDEAGGVGDGYSLDAVDGDPTDALFVDIEGRVGIGTNNPVAGRLVVQDSAGATIWAYSEVGTALEGRSQDGKALNVYSSTGYAAYLDGQVYMSDDVGLGTLTPERKLHLLGDNPRILIDAVTSNPEINFRNSGDAYSEMWALYKDDGTDDLRLFQAGDKVTFESQTGNVGIGTANPVSKLDVAGGCNVGLAYSIAGSTVVAVDSESNTHIGVGAGAGNSSGFSTFVGHHAGNVSDAAANTFIGASAGATTTAGLNTMLGAFAGQFHVDGSHNVFLGSYAGQGHGTGLENTYVGAGAGFMPGTGDQNTVIGAAAGAYAGGSGNVLIGYGSGSTESGSDKLCIANGPLNDDVLIYGDFAEGRVGIGVVDPIATLTVNANPEMTTMDGPSICLGSDGPAVFYMGGGSGFCSLHWNNPEAMDIFSTDRIRFLPGTSAANQIMFSADGDVGIGTGTPEEELHIVGDNPRVLIEAETSKPEINFKSTGDPSAVIWALYKDDSNDDLYFLQDGTIRVALKNGTGALGIGTHNVGTYELYVQGEAYATGGWSPSDLRFKDEIEGIEDALGKVLGLRGVRFKWKTDEFGDRGFPEGRHYGVIAQDAETVLPEIVKEGPAGDKAIAYAEIIPVLIESIRELKAENEELKHRMAIIEAAVSLED